MSDSDLKSVRRVQKELNLTECYQEGGAREFERSWPPSLQKSLTLAHDVNRALIREKDAMQRTLDKTLLEVMRERKWRKWLWRAIVAIAVTVCGILKWLIPYAVRGMLK